MTFLARLRRVEAGDRDPETVFDLASAALAEGEEERALPLVRAAAEQSSDASLWQWAGLLNRALDEHQAALECFAAAARLAPDDAKIAHGYAHVALEAGVEAVPLFERARHLAPQDPTILQGLSAARMAAGQGRLAVEELAGIVERAPLWIEGHHQLAQLRSLIGETSSATASLDLALARQPEEAALWLALCDLQLRRAAYRELRDAVTRARAAGVPIPALEFYHAVAAGELSEADADRLLSEQAVAGNPQLGLWRIRHLLRRGRATDAAPLVDRELRSERRQAIWPYAAIVWRLLRDARSAWLEEQDGLIHTTEIIVDLEQLHALARYLRILHGRSGQFMDQSVRGGSQTDGPLLSRIAPEIRQLRTAIVAAVDRYIAQLPPPDPAHPLLAERRERRVRFSGSWSVLLRGGGQHANHVHPLGWISSALYIDLPARLPRDPEAGWLVLGEPQAEIGVELPAQAKIEPRRGRLVLFPSWMWHGTRPFAEGNRLTVAFDVAKQR